MIVSYAFGDGTARVDGAVDVVNSWIQGEVPQICFGITSSFYDWNVLVSDSDLVGAEGSGAFGITELAD